MSPVMVPATDHAPVVRSFDPEDFVVPHGREEEWRFTPLDRLHELQLSPVVTTRPVVSVNAVDAVTAQRLANEDGAQSLVPTPVDRIGASAWLLSDEVTVISVPAGSQ
jgi:Fe-S cluster assembly protein SufD